MAEKMQKGTEEEEDDDDDEETGGGGSHRGRINFHISSTSPEGE